MPELQLLRHDHGPALLVFEQENRSYFAATVPDRGDAYFAEFDAQHQESLASQAEGTGYCHVFVEDDGEIVGRVNLAEVADGSASLGYRIAERATGRGLATAGTREVCALAIDVYGLSVLHASTTIDNLASQRILTRTRFIPVGDVMLSGHPGIRYRKELSHDTS